tara:strand:- start:383 stop:1267 length:885 start_codon:yes stop_codon:yes gene_type:complete
MAFGNRNAPDPGQRKKQNPPARYGGKYTDGQLASMAGGYFLGGSSGGDASHLAASAVSAGKAIGKVVGAISAQNKSGAPNRINKNPRDYPKPPTLNQIPQTYRLPPAKEAARVRPSSFQAADVSKVDGGPQTGPHSTYHKLNDGRDETGLFNTKSIHTGYTGPDDRSFPGGSYTVRNDSIEKRPGTIGDMLGEQTMYDNSISRGRWPEGHYHGKVPNTPPVVTATKIREGIVSSPPTPRVIPEDPPEEATIKLPEPYNKSDLPAPSRGYWQDRNSGQPGVKKSKKTTKKAPTKR